MRKREAGGESHVVEREKDGGRSAADARNADQSLKGAPLTRKMQITRFTGYVGRGSNKKGKRGRKWLREKGEGGEQGD